jgi:hypothetical protein
MTDHDKQTEAVIRRAKRMSAELDRLLESIELHTDILFQDRAIADRRKKLAFEEGLPLRPAHVAEQELHEHDGAAWDKHRPQSQRWEVITLDWQSGQRVSADILPFKRGKR